MKDRDEGKMTEADLVRQLGELPRRIEPRNDPWPQIFDRITSEVPPASRPGSSWLRLAAAVALAFALGIFLGKSLQLSSPLAQAVDPVAQEDDGSAQSPEFGGALAGAEREYQAAFSEFAMIGQAAELKPATLDSIERDWQVMLDAEAALTAALEQYPNNPWLNKRMLELRERQLAMLKLLAGFDRTSRRTEI